MYIILERRGDILCWLIWCALYSRYILYWFMCSSVLDANFLAHPGRTKNMQGNSIDDYYLRDTRCFTLVQSESKIRRDLLPPPHEWPKSSYISANTFVNLPQTTVPCMEHLRQVGFGRLISASPVKVRLVALYEWGTQPIIVIIYPYIAWLSTREKHSWFLYPSIICHAKKPWQKTYDNPRN